MRIMQVLAIAISMLLIVSAGVRAAEPQSLIVAGGCFWCVESDFDHVKGVVETTSGYSGGDLENPTYHNHSGHLEVLKIDYDPDVVTLDELLVAFWRSVDPTDPGGQFCDRGHSYTTAIYVTPEQRAAAEASKAAAQAELGDKEIVTPILDAKTFWPAEDYHQNYHNKNPVRYNFYRFTCGRNQTVDALWGDSAYMNIAH